MENLIELKPEDQAVVKKAEEIANEITIFVIASQDQYVRAGEYLKHTKSAYKQLEDTRMSLTRPLDDSKKRIMELFRPVMEKIAEAEAKLKRAMLFYQHEQETKRLEAERKLQAEAEKKRQEAFAKAAAAREAGKEDKAEKYEEKAAQIIAPQLAPTVEKVAGIATKKVWKFEITDEVALPRKYLVPDLTQIGREVRACGNTLSIPGVRIWAEETIAAGRI